MIEDFLNKVVCGDCLQVMRQLPDESVDCVITDSPYGYGFLGKDWDRAVPSVAVWKECLRVLKSGAFAFVMSAPRQDVLTQMIVRLGEAGFNTGFTSLYWAYSSGFPKAGNIGKMVDKRQGAVRQGAGSKGNTFPLDEEYETGEAITEDAKRLDGSFAGFQPKPAVEIVIVVMKPLSEKTFVEQALKNGKGVTWLDEGRIPYNPEDTPLGGFGGMDIGIAKPLEHQDYSGCNPANSGDRFPANLLVEDSVLDDGSISKSTASIRHNKSGMGVIGHGTNTIGVGDVFSPYSDSGGFSRYFSLDAWWDKRIEKLPREVLKVFPFLIVPKASKSEKNKGCEKLLDKDMKRGIDTEGRTPNDLMERFATKPAKNHHPTVKPLKLFSYLTTIGSREHEIVLDPFCGSGTIGVAARILNRKFIGIELMKEYAEIANARIAPVLAQKKLYEVWKGGRR